MICYIDSGVVDGVAMITVRFISEPRGFDRISRFGSLAARDARSSTDCFCGCKVLVGLCAANAALTFPGKTFPRCDVLHFTFQNLSFDAYRFRMTICTDVITFL